MKEETAPATNLAGFRALVKQGKALLEEQVNINWKLGELASQVDKEYGKAKLQEFADELEVNHSTLLNYRTTYLAWPEKSRRRDFSVCAALNAHPRHVEILEKNPDLTVREAYAKMQEYREREAVVIADHALGLPVFRALSLCTCRRHYPGAASERIASLISSRRVSLPR